MSHCTNLNKRRFGCISRSSSSSSIDCSAKEGIGNINRHSKTEIMAVLESMSVLEKATATTNTIITKSTIIKPKNWTEI